MKPLSAINFRESNSYSKKTRKKNHFNNSTFFTRERLSSAYTYTPNRKNPYNDQDKQELSKHILNRDLCSSLLISQIIPNNKIPNITMRRLIQENIFPKEDPSNNNTSKNIACQTVKSRLSNSTKSPQSSKNIFNHIKIKEKYIDCQEKPTDEEMKRIEDIYTESRFIKFRTENILKFARNEETITKLNSYMEYLNDDKRNLCEGYRNSFKKLNSLIGNHIFHYGKMGEMNFNEWKKTVKFQYDYTSNILKLILLLFKEIKEQKEKIVQLEQKNYDIEKLLDIKIKELKDLNEYIIKTGMNIKKTKEKEKQYNYEHKEFFKRENSYVLTIYRLEEEVRDLTNLLNKNAVDVKRVKEREEESENIKKERDTLSYKFIKDINELNNRIIVQKDEISDLEDKITQMEKQNIIFKESQNEQNLIIKELTAQKLKLKETLDAYRDEMEKLKEEIEEYKKKKRDSVIKLVNNSDSKEID